MSLQEVLLTLKGSSSSGNFGHSGNPPHHGGSSPGGGHLAIGIPEGSSDIKEKVSKYRKGDKTEEPKAEKKVEQNNEPYSTPKREDLLKEYNLGWDTNKNEFTGNCEKISCESINDYTSSLYVGINSYLRMGPPIPGLKESEAKQIINDIDKSLDNLPRTKENIIVHRGVSEDVFNKLEIGQSFIDKAFVSTTINPKVAKTFGSYIFEVRVPKGSKGVYVEGVSNFFKEQEFLLPRNSNFKVISKKGKNIVIELQNG